MMFARITNEAPDVDEQGRLLTRVAEMVDAGTVRSTLTRIFEGPVPDAAAGSRTAVVRWQHR